MLYQLSSSHIRPTLVRSGNVKPGLDPPVKSGQVRPDQFISTEFKQILTSSQAKQDPVKSGQVRRAQIISIRPDPVKLSQVISGQVTLSHVQYAHVKSSQVSISHFRPPQAVSAQFEPCQGRFCQVSHKIKSSQLDWIKWDQVKSSQVRPSQIRHFFCSVTFLDRRKPAT